MPQAKDPYRLIGKRVRYFSTKRGGWTGGVIVDFEFSKDEHAKEYLKDTLKSEHLIYLLKNLNPAHKVQIQLEGDRPIWRDWPTDKMKIMTEGEASKDNTAMLEKIMKLLRLASSPYPAEAEAAMQKAYKLMAENDIKMEDVKEEKKYVDEVCPTGEKVYEEHLLVARICRDFFKVVYFIDNMENGQGIRFVGKRHHVEISLYVYSFLVYTFRQILKKANKIEKVEDRVSFMRGLYDGLYNKLLESRKKIEEENAIVLVDDKDLDKFMRDKWKLEDAKRKSRISSGRSYQQGLVEGGKIDIYDGVEGKEKDGAKEIGEGQKRLGGSK